MTDTSVSHVGPEIIFVLSLFCPNMSNDWSEICLLNDLGSLLSGPSELSNFISKFVFV